MAAADAVLLIAFGGPSRFEEVRPFLSNVLKGIPVPPERVEEVVRHYELIGGASPITEVTTRQAAALEAALKAEGVNLPVFVGMRNWHPMIRDLLPDLAARGMKRILGIILSAHRSDASIEKYRRTVEEARAVMGSDAPIVEYAGPWFDHPAFIEAVADRVRETLASWSPERWRRAAWVFTAHSIPVPMAKASPYVEDLMTSVRGVAAALNLPAWRLAYQSRSGSPHEPWLGPEVLEVIDETAAQGAKDIVVVPIGFVSDHVEVLYDLDVEAADRIRTKGMSLWRVPTVGTHPKFITMLAEVVKRACRTSS